MTAYEVIQQHPEWVESERTPKAAIQERAKRYVEDYKGNGNFANGITKDLDDLLSLRDVTNDFAGVVADGNTAQANTDSPEYLTDRRKAQIYAIFVKAVITELSGKAICTAAQVEEWRERYAVKLEGLQARPDRNIKRNESQHINYIDLGDSTAKALYIELNDQKTIIDCSEKTFLWYFGSDKNRADIEQPERIKWYERANAFAYLCLLIKIRITGSTEYKQIDWEKAKRIFSNETDSSWKSQALSNYVSGYRNNESLPDNFDIKALCKAKEKLVELRKKMEK